eukprot:gene10883-14605_t
MIKVNIIYFEDICSLLLFLQSHDGHALAQNGADYSITNNIKFLEIGADGGWIIPSIPINCLTAIGKQFKNLESLKYIHPQFYTTDSDLMKSSLFLTKLKALSFRCTSKTTAVGITSILLGNHSSLTSLEIFEGGESFKITSPLLFTNLKELKLISLCPSNYISSEVIYAISYGLTGLLKLTLEQNIEDDQMNLILRNLKCLTYLKCNLANNFTGTYLTGSLPDSLIELHLNYCCNLSKDRLLAILSNNLYNLTTLSFEALSSFMGLEVALDYDSVFPPSLTSLRLNNIGKSISWLNNFCSSSRLANLKSLNLSDNSWFTGEDITQSFPCGLEDLNLSCCRISIDGLINLLETRKNLSNLKSLDLSGSSLSKRKDFEEVDYYYTQVLPPLSNSLVKLNLSSTAIGYVEIDELLLCDTYPNLQSVNLSHNYRISIHSVADLLKSLSSLQEIRLIRCMIDKDDAIEVQEIFPNITFYFKY